MRFRRPSQAKVGIDMAPLVDVVFLLVIFFAVSTTFLETSGMKLELPESTASTDREAKEVAVFLGSDGSVVFEEATITVDELASRLRAALENDDRKMVVLRADTGTPHGQVVEIMDVIREAGAEGLMVATRAKDQ